MDAIIVVVGQYTVNVRYLNTCDHIYKRTTHLEPQRAESVSSLCLTVMKLVQMVSCLKICTNEHCTERSDDVHASLLHYVHGRNGLEKEKNLVVSKLKCYFCKSGSQFPSNYTFQRAIDFVSTGS